MSMISEDNRFDSYKSEIDFMNESFLIDKNAEIEIPNKNSVIVKIPLRKSLILVINLQDGYPKFLPTLIKCHTYDLNNLKPQRRQAIEEFLKNTELELNQIVDELNGKSCILQMYQRSKVLLENDLYIHECFEVVESQASTKKQMFTNETNEEDGGKKVKQKKSQNKTTKEAAEETKSSKLKGADFIFQRIKWDSAVDKSQIIVGYLDRFLGVKEIDFNEFKGVHDDRDGIPLHRIRHFKINDKVVWDREQRIDLLSNAGDISKFFKQTDSPKVSNINIENLDDIDDQISTLPEITEAEVSEFSSNKWNETNLNSKIDHASKDLEFVDDLKFLTYNVMSRNNLKKSLNETMKKAKHSAGVEDLDQIERMDKVNRYYHYL